MGNLEIIRLALDLAICLGCGLLLIGFWRQRTLSGRPGAANRTTSSGPQEKRPGDLPHPAEGPDPLSGKASSAATQEKVLQLSRAGLPVTEIARRTGLTRGHVALIRKFKDAP